MTSQEPFVLTSRDLLAAELRLFQADVDLATRVGDCGSSALYWDKSQWTPPAPVLPDPDQGKPAGS